MDQLLLKIRACEVCRNFLPDKPRPIIQASTQSKIIIIGQAPGKKVQQSGIPWNDPSGKELQRWLGVSQEQFYNHTIFSFIPMGFCYPGKGKSGDLPPRPECAPLWHKLLLAEMNEVKLTILIGFYAQKYYLNDQSVNTVTEIVKGYENFLPYYFPLVHPSPRNKLWQKKNQWFEMELLPDLQRIVKQII